MLINWMNTIFKIWWDKTKVFTPLGFFVAIFLSKTDEWLAAFKPDKILVLLIFISFTINIIKESLLKFDIFPHIKNFFESYEKLWRKELFELYVTTIAFVTGVLFGGFYYLTFEDFCKYLKVIGIMYLIYIFIKFFDYVSSSDFPSLRLNNVLILKAFGYFIFLYWLICKYNKPA